MMNPVVRNFYLWFVLDQDQKDIFPDYTKCPKFNRTNNFLSVDYYSRFLINKTDVYIPGEGDATGRTVNMSFLIFNNLTHKIK